MIAKQYSLCSLLMGTTVFAVILSSPHWFPWQFLDPASLVVWTFCTGLLLVAVGSIRQAFRSSSGHTMVRLGGLVMICVPTAVFVFHGILIILGMIQRWLESS